MIINTVLTIIEQRFKHQRLIMTKFRHQHVDMLLVMLKNTKYCIHYILKACGLLFDDSVIVHIEVYEPRLQFNLHLFVSSCFPVCYSYNMVTEKLEVVNILYIQILIGEELLASLDVKNSNTLETLEVSSVVKGMFPNFLACHRHDVNDIGSVTN